MNRGVHECFNLLNLEIMIFNSDLCKELLEQAAASPRLRVNVDLRNSPKDTSQRVLYALAVGTEVPIHRHEDTAESVVCLCGRLEEIFYEFRDGNYCEAERHLLDPIAGRFGIQVPAGVWHSIRVLEPAVIFEAKDGAYVAPAPK